MDVHVERVLFKRIALSPDPIEHLLAREHAVRGLEELLENLEFFGGQLDGLALDQDFVTIKVRPKRSRVILDLRYEAGLATSQDGADAGDQFTDTLTAHDQIDSLLIGVQTLFILAREVSFSDG